MIKYTILITTILVLFYSVGYFVHRSKCVVTGRYYEKEATKITYRFYHSTQSMGWNGFVAELFRPMMNIVDPDITIVVKPGTKWHENFLAINSLYKKSTGNDIPDDSYIWDKDDHTNVFNDDFKINLDLPIRMTR